MKNYIAFDVGGTKVKYGVLNERGEILESGKYNTRYTVLDEFVSDMLLVIEEYKNKYEISGIAISLPGFINYKTGHAYMAGAIEALHGRNLKEILEGKINIPVEIENDANCVALAEKFNGNATECSDFICITIGTGIGGGIMVDNKIVHGHSFRGGEFGFMITSDAKGDEKMMSQNASTNALVTSYKKYKGLDEKTLIEGYQVFEEAEKDENVNKIIEAWYEMIARGIFNLASVLNPEKILIGGGVSERKDFIPHLEEYLDANDIWKDIKVKLVTCKHGNNAGMIGAVYNFISMHK